MASEPNDISAVVFDMGGVIVELGPLVDLLGDDPMEPAVFWPRWLASPTVRAFEMGKLSPETFGDRLVAEFGLGFSGAELVERFAAWPRGLLPGAESLTQRVRHRVVSAVLTNTNPMHWSTQTDGDRIRSMFDRCYLSFELGLVKPDAAVFELVVADLGLPPGRVFFIDDNQVNVDGARSAGLRAELARGVDEAERLLLDIGVV